VALHVTAANEQDSRPGEKSPNRCKRIPEIMWSCYVDQGYTGKPRGARPPSTLQLEVVKPQHPPQTTKNTKRGFVMLAAPLGGGTQASPGLTDSADWPEDYEETIANPRRLPLLRLRLHLLGRIFKMLN